MQSSLSMWAEGMKRGSILVQVVCRSRENLEEDDCKQLKCVVIFCRRTVMTV